MGPQEGERIDCWLRSQHLDALFVAQRAEGSQECLQGRASAVFQHAESPQRNARSFRCSTLVEIARQAQLAYAVSEVMLEIIDTICHSAIICYLTPIAAIKGI